MWVGCWWASDLHISLETIYFDLPFDFANVHLFYIYPFGSKSHICLWVHIEPFIVERIISQARIPRPEFFALTATFFTRTSSFLCELANRVSLLTNMNLYMLLLCMARSVATFWLLLCIGLEFQDVPFLSTEYTEVAVGLFSEVTGIVVSTSEEVWPERLRNKAFLSLIPMRGANIMAL